MKLIDLGSRRQGHWQPVRSAILATAGLLISLYVAAPINIALVDAVRQRAVSQLIQNRCCHSVRRQTILDGCSRLQFSRFSNFQKRRI